MMGQTLSIQGKNLDGTRVARVSPLGECAIEHKEMRSLKDSKKFCDRAGDGKTVQI